MRAATMLLRLSALVANTSGWAFQGDAGLPKAEGDFELPPVQTVVSTPVALLSMMIVPLGAVLAYRFLRRAVGASMAMGADGAPVRPGWGAVGHQD